MRQIEDTGCYSRRLGPLPKGCSRCVKGKKLVLFVTGLCPKSCDYCPISEQKKDKDVIFANERPVEKDNDIIDETKLSSAVGAGFTGGDPLIRLERTLHYIRLLKDEFGHGFHIHLYTPLDLVKEDTLRKLHDAGLDEIRFHPDFDKPEEWDRLKAAQDFNWDYGIEIPAIPEKKEQTTKLIDYSKGLIQFLNINELEISDTNAMRTTYEPKDMISYAVKGSEELALELMEYCKDKNFNVHYCTTTLKDRIQMANRIKLRAKNIAKAFDKVTDEGLLLRAAVYLDDLAPGKDYNKNKETINKEKTIAKLEDIKEKIKKKFTIKEEQIFLDKKNLRLLTRSAIAKRIARQYTTAIVEEYPTWDGFTVNLEMQ